MYLLKSKFVDEKVIALYSTSQLAQQAFRPGIAMIRLAITPNALDVMAHLIKNLGQKYICFEPFPLKIVLG